MATTRSSLSPAAVPAEIGAALVTAVVEESVVASIATVHTTAKRALSFPLITSDVTAYDVAEAAQITLSDIGTGQVEVAPVKVVAAARWSNEALSDALNDESGGALGILSSSIARGIATRIDLNALATIGAASGTFNAGSTDLSDLDRFHAGIAQLRKVGATPSTILVSPATALRLATVKTNGEEGTRTYLLAPSVQDSADLSVGGVPFVVSRHVPDNRAFVVSADRLAFVVRSEASLELDRSVFALTRETLVLGEARAALGVLQPEAIAVVTITAP